MAHRKIDCTPVEECASQATDHLDATFAIVFGELGFHPFENKHPEVGFMVVVIAAKKD